LIANETKTGFEDQRLLSEDARRQCALSRVELEIHISEHGC
jgi:hypothetical protein